MKNYVVSLCVGAALIVSIAGCSRNIGSNNYSSASVGEAMTTYAGVVVNVRKVQIQEGDKLTDNVAGEMKQTKAHDYSYILQQARLTHVIIST